MKYDNCLISFASQCCSHAAGPNVRWVNINMESARRTCQTRDETLRRLSTTALLLLVCVLPLWPRYVRERARLDHARQKTPEAAKYFLAPSTPRPRLCAHTLDRGMCRVKVNLRRGVRIRHIVGCARFWYNIFLITHALSVRCAHIIIIWCLCAFRARLR